MHFLATILEMQREVSSLMPSSETCFRATAVRNPACILSSAAMDFRRDEVRRKVELLLMASGEGLSTCSLFLQEGKASSPTSFTTSANDCQLADILLAIKTIKPQTWNGEL